MIEPGPTIWLEPHTDNFFDSRLWSITSKALRKSTKIPNFIIIHPKQNFVSDPDNMPFQ